MEVLRGDEALAEQGHPPSAGITRHVQHQHLSDGAARARALN